MCPDTDEAPLLGRWVSLADSTIFVKLIFVLGLAKAWACCSSSSTFMALSLLIFFAGCEERGGQHETGKVGERKCPGAVGQPPHLS